MVTIDADGFRGHTRPIRVVATLAVTLPRDDCLWSLLTFWWITATLLVRSLVRGIEPGVQVILLRFRCIGSLD